MHHINNPEPQSRVRQDTSSLILKEHLKVTSNIKDPQTFMFLYAIVQFNIPSEQALGDNVKEKLPFDKKREFFFFLFQGGHLSQPAGGEGRETRQNTLWEREPEINNN